MKNMKTMVMKEDEREKQQSWQNQEYVQSATNRILIIHSSKQMNVKEKYLIGEIEIAELGKLYKY